MASICRIVKQVILMIIILMGLMKAEDSSFSVSMGDLDKFRLCSLKCFRKCNYSFYPNCFHACHSKCSSHASLLDACSLDCDDAIPSYSLRGNYYY